ncbi:hypothetical protein GLOTRDRAFT_141184 [Gloeophyllum trabeum ATCC 11539]|uniref:Protein kinase domain-containing protein n=1 Tax=Gloeophyllum trabeum (strain ATCC 11539 / FP-39264 / Madison 617) TaxID=670483 RepID=S7PUI9_GLOTA|nr:uncharacterized protein GLOTRDRAFT_141184 [Gloeophyllum trabeum ATCC 11539]EPQ51033.1 hypothetical protein GLOTRDRAFT_141184 [Gloeophyllum trabeum ATCC 11539]
MARSVLQLVEAFRDIIAAQRNLALRGIVHRDISTRNMLLNERLDAGVGTRGILIDFDMAKFIDRTTSGESTDGTRLFQSIKVLLGLGKHDYLDDLESSFYGLCWFAFTLERPCVPRASIPVTLKNWDSPNLQLAADAKRSFINDPPMVGDLIAPTMSPYLEGLLLRLQTFFRETALPRIAEYQAQQDEEARKKKEKRTAALKKFERLEGTWVEEPRNVPDPLDTSAEQMEKHFQEVLKHVDNAITLLKEDPDEDAIASNASAPSGIDEHERRIPVWENAYSSESDAHSSSSGMTLPLPPMQEIHVLLPPLHQVQKKGSKKLLLDHVSMPPKPSEKEKARRDSSSTQSSGSQKRVRELEDNLQRRDLGDARRSSKRYKNKRGFRDSSPK